jgi:FkbM family methyltransferase
MIQRIVHRLPMTRVKLGLAGIAYRVTKLAFKTDIHVVERRGIRYEVDLREAIDLTIFLLGGFQTHVTANRLLDLPSDAVAIDVGANIGAMSLRLAQALPSGRVYAFEPTDYAYHRLERNLELNLELKERIRAFKRFVSDGSTDGETPTAYSSWKVDGGHSDSHPLHGGTAQTATETGTITIDEFCRAENLSRLDFIKIDTDGSEFLVLKGARGTLADKRPAVVFEVGQYLLEERGIDTDEMLRFWAELGYRLTNCANGSPVTPANFHREVPLRSTTDLLALPVP